MNITVGEAMVLFPIVYFGLVGLLVYLDRNNDPREDE